MYEFTFQRRWRNSEENSSFKKKADDTQNKTIMYFVIVLIHLLPYDMSKLRFSFCSRCYLFVNFPLPCQGSKNRTCHFETSVEILQQLSRTCHDRRYGTARRIKIVSRFSRDERLDRTGSCLVELVCFNEMPLQVYI